MSTSPVRDVLRSATVPADRPRDHLQRVSSGLFVGNTVGTVAAMLFFAQHLSPLQLALTSGILLAASVLFISPWFTRPAQDLRFPVVARTLATSESRASRTVREGIRVPVVAKPVDGGAPFRSFLTIASQHDDPIPGTLFPAYQADPAMGELIMAMEISDEHRPVLDRLSRHPKELPSTAAILPMRRGALEPRPWWAALTLGASALLGAALPWALMAWMAS